jgi:hypothetical protein
LATKVRAAVVGGNGMLSSCGGAGMLLALTEAYGELDDLKLLGASGGVFPTMLWRGSDLSMLQVATLIATSKLSRVVSPGQSMPRYLWRRLVSQGEDQLDNSMQGLIKSQGIRDMFNRKCAGWPPGISIVTVNPYGECFLLNAEGLFLHRDGTSYHLCRRQANLGAAAQATCAVQEWVQAVRLEEAFDPESIGEIREAIEAMGLGKSAFPSSFHDGAFGPYGGCPAEGIPVQYGIPASQIAACMPGGFLSDVLRNAYICGRKVRPRLPLLPYDHHAHRTNAAVVIESKFHFAAQLNDTSTRAKVRMMLASFRETNRQLAAAGEEVPTEREQREAMMRLCEATDCPLPRRLKALGVR